MSEMLCVRMTRWRAALISLLLCACDAPARGDVNSSADAAARADGGKADAGPSRPSERVDAGPVVHWRDAGVDQSCGVVKAQAQPKQGAVDVVWVIDDSPSMLPQVLPIGENLTSFLDGVRAGGGDISVVMVTGPVVGSYVAGMITDTNYHWLAAPVQSHDAFDWALNMHPDWSKITRSGAALHFVFVTDDFSIMSGADFMTRMQDTVKQPFTVHAVATRGLGTECLGAPPFVGGGEYYAAAEATGGEQLTLCDDWGAGFDKLQSSVVASVPLPCAYPIPAPPNGERLDPDAVQVSYTQAGRGSEEFARAALEAQCADNVAWHFDAPAAPTSVVLCPRACELVKAGGAIELGFGCAPTVVLRVAPR